MKLTSIILLAAIISISVSGTGCERLSRSSATATLLPKSISSETVFPGKRILGDCVVTAYDENGEKYFTNQRHEIFEQPVTIVVTATEAEGDITWFLSEGKYETDSAAKLDHLLCNRQIASAILSLHLASGGLYEGLAGVELEPVKLDGQWYNPLEITPKGIESDRIILFRSSNKKHINRVTVADMFGNNAFTAKGHNERIFRDEGISIPGKIDVFSTGKDGQAKALVLQIDYHRLDVDEFHSSDINAEKAGR